MTAVDAGIWGIRVDETRIDASGRGKQWWFWYRNMSDRSTKPCAILTSTLGGEMVFMERQSRDDAEWVAAYMISQGVPKSAVRVMRAPYGQGTLT